MRKAAGALVLFFLISPTPAQAQNTAGLRPGDRVRVTAPDCAFQKGRAEFRAVVGDSLVLEVDGVELTCPMAAISSFEVHRGRPSWRPPARMGALAGAMGGAVIGLDSKECGGALGKACGVFGAGLGAFVGYFSGGVIGSVLGRGRWEDLPLPPVQSSLFISNGNRLHLGLSIPLRR